MTDVRLTALNPVDSQVYPVACNTSGELLVADGGPDLTVTGDLTVDGKTSISLGSQATPSLIFGTDVNSGLFQPGADSLAIATAGTQRVTVDSSGRLLVGSTSDVSGGLSTTLIQGVATGGGYVGLARNDTSVGDGNGIGGLRFYANDPSGYNDVGIIQCVADGTHATNDYPTRLEFQTTADGASSPTVRMVIDNTGAVGIGNTSPSSYTSVARNLVLGNHSSHAGLTIASGSSSAGTLTFSSGTSGSQLYRAQIAYYHSSDHMAFNVGGGLERMRIDSNGNIFIGGHSAGTADIALNANGTATFLGDVTAPNITSLNTLVKELQTKMSLIMRQIDISADTP